MFYIWPYAIPTWNVLEKYQTDLLCTLHMQFLKNYLLLYLSLLSSLDSNNKNSV